MKIRDLSLFIASDLLDQIKSAIDEFVAAGNALDNALVLSLSVSKLATKIDTTFQFNPFWDDLWTGYISNPFGPVNIGMIRGLIWESESDWLESSIDGSTLWKYNTFYPDPLNDQGTKVYQLGTYWDPALDTKNWELLADIILAVSGILLIIILHHIGFGEIASYLGKRLISNKKSISKAAKLNKLYAQMDENDPTSLVSVSQSTNSSLGNLGAGKTIASIISKLELNVDLVDIIGSNGSLEQFIASFLDEGGSIEVMIDQLLDYFSEEPNYKLLASKLAKFLR